RREDDEQRIGPCRIIITRRPHRECKLVGGLQIVVEICVTRSAAGTASRRDTGFRPGGGDFGPRGGRKYQKAKCQDQNQCDKRGGLARNANSHGPPPRDRDRANRRCAGAYLKRSAKNFKERLGPSSSSSKRAYNWKGTATAGKLKRSVG